nr:DUF2721 domain-containing protein [Desulfobulbaceae bacterium]
MELTLTTPALLFPTVSLLMVAYTNRFLAIASRIRTLHESYRNSPNTNLAEQITSLRTRVRLIKNMQACAISTLLLCVLCMFVLFAGFPLTGKIIFATSLALLIVSLGLSFREVMLSVEALNLALSDMETSEVKK